MPCRRAGFAILLLAAALAGPARAAEAPTKDVKGARDSPIVSRFSGAVIIGYRQQDYAALTLPLGPSARDQKGRFALSRTVEGRVTSIAYAIPQGKSALEVFRSYERALAAAGFRVAYACGVDSCGGYDFAAALADPVNHAMGGDLFGLRIDLLDATNGNVQSLTARLDRPEGSVDVSVLVSQDGSHQPGVLLQIVEGRPMQAGQVVVDAKAMGEGLASAGHVALDGIQFETDSAVLKPESDATLAQMAAFLTQDAKRQVAIVGHTDTVGVLEHNLALSQARAAAVAKALTTRFGIAAARLQARGLGPYAPVAGNATEAGRARNRRVELVER
ncbi:OmpA family protein [uncultured Methylobacterium sp.]|uniref:OmpA family protein n=1 Tax=uncultured Methylobacterium sp. TaxID=157278 RepID=UPI0025872BD2|nr:OmpA family protein [uncultured Methylobacterium sp.]